MKSVPDHYFFKFSGLLFLIHQGSAKCWSITTAPWVLKGLRVLVLLLFSFCCKFYSLCFSV